MVKHCQPIALKVVGMEGEIMSHEIMHKYWCPIRVFVRGVDLAGLLIRSRVNLAMNRVFSSLLIGLSTACISVKPNCQG
jgi:hypothetical protein